MKDSTFNQGLYLIEIVTQKQFNEEQIKVYKMLLDDISEENFIQGINTMLRDRVYTNIPSPAEIRKFCLETREDDLNIRIAQAKNKVSNAILSVGTYKTVVFDDPIIHLIIRDFGGWIKIGKLPIEEFEDLLKWDFPKLYKAYASRKNSEIPLMLTGLAGKEEIAYIGDTEKAKRWTLAYESKMQIENNKDGNREINKLISDVKNVMIA